MGDRLLKRLLPACAASVALCALAWAGPDALPAPVAGPHYYRSTELDVRPAIKVYVEPQYPEQAARRGLSGRVVLRLYLNESGAVERVVVVKGDPPGTFEDAAQRAFAAARFTPGIKGKRAVKTQMTIEVSFDSPPSPAPPAGLR